jgi:hypothetical protein
MSESEGFLARWNRRKHAAKQEREEAAASEKTPTDANAPPPGWQGAETGTPLQPAVSPVSFCARGREVVELTPPFHPTVDLSTLPPIDTITATTDIRPFLAQGVPEELKRAALRRAWTADPAIRDFVGIAENQWDFTVPNEAIGFGPLGSGEAVRKLVARVFGDEGPNDRTGASDSAISAENIGANAPNADPALAAPPERNVAEASQQIIVQRSETNNASQPSETEDEDSGAGPPWGRGSALSR